MPLREGRGSIRQRPSVKCLLLRRATTHSDLILRATERNISYQVVHNASIINAVGCCGLQVGAREDRDGY